MKKSLFAAVLVILAAGCAAPEASTEATREPEYRTGSNIPRKGKDGANRVESVSKEELERSRAGVVNSAPAEPR